MDKEKKFTGLFVEVKHKDDLDKALQKLKRMIKDSNLWVEHERARQYTKPSATKRDIRNRAKARQRYLTKKTQ